MVHYILGSFLLWVPIYCRKCLSSKRRLSGTRSILHEAQTHQLVKQLEEGRLDCLILAQVAETEPFIELDLYDEPLYVAVPCDHEWATEETLAMSQLDGKTILALGDGHCLRDQALGFCFAAGAKDDERFKATSLETLRNMVAAGEVLPYCLNYPCQKIEFRMGFVT